MKKFTNYMLLLGCIMMIGSLSLRSQISSYNKECADYWLNKMSDPNLNYFTLVEEFDQYREGKTPGNNSGYKLFKRWQHQMITYVNPDGSLLAADHNINEYQKFIQQNAGDEIVGTWSLVGPTLFPEQYYSGQCPGLGRISALAFHPTNSNTLYAGAPVGGLWKTTDGGNNWNNLNTDDINTMGVSDIVIDYTNPNILYIATGDRDGWESWGLGVYKSVDGGLTWVQKNTGMGNKVMAKLLMNPDNHNYLIAAAQDGIYISSNAGENWLKVFTSQSTMKDLVFKPGSPYYIYACDKGAVYRSIDYGSTWSNILNTDSHRMVLAITPANPEKLYVIATKNSVFGALYFSDNSGANFTQINSTGLSSEGQGGYNLDLAADPNNQNTLYLGMVNVYKSTNGGFSFTKILNTGQIHADQHVFEFSPHTSDYMFIGNDGGVYKVLIAGGSNTVTTISNGLAISEVYRISTSATNPDLMISGMQDCGSYITSSNPWLHRLGGDGMNCEIDYSNTDIMYGSSQDGNISRSMDGGNSFSGIASDGVNGINQTGGWYSAFVLDQFTSNIMFAGFKDVWRSVNVNTTVPGNVNWTNISAGQLSGEVIDLIEQSPADGNYIFAADGGGNRFFMTTNAYSASPAWIELAKPYSHKITWIEAHPTDKNIFYFTIVDVVYKYNILTETWTNLTDNLPWVAKLCIVYQKNSNEGLYVGTATGVFYKDAEMTDWVVYKSDLPTTKVFDLEINYHTDPPQLFAATFGRGIWKTDVYPSPKPNLVASGISSQVTGTLVEMVIGYQNQSAIASTDPFKIGYFLSTNSIISPGDYLIDDESEPGAAPLLIGQGHLQTTNVALITPEIPSGTYYMGAYLDNENEVNEISETDNWVTATHQVTIPPAPAAPTNVQATDGSVTNWINISWTAPAGGTFYYRIYRNTTNDPAGAVNVSGTDFIPGTAFNDFNAPRGIDVYYWVKASAYIQGVHASDFSASNAGWYPVAPPTNVQATDGQFSVRVTITWSPPANATHYRVYRSPVNNSSLSANISGTSWITNEYFNDVTAVAGTTYYYWVKAARSSTGTRSSDYSAVNSGWVAFASAPDAIASDGTYTDKVTVTWNTVTGASYYKLFRNTVNNPETSSAQTGWQTAASYNDVSTATGIIYYYWVMAGNDAVGSLSTGYGQGDSGWENFVPPTNLHASDGTMIENTNISWSYSPNASWYRVYRHTQGNFTNALPIGNWTSFSAFNDVTSVPGLTHFYWVVAAGDTLVTVSQPSTSESGWCLLHEPAVTASKGLFNDLVNVAWSEVNGGIAYRVYRSSVSSPTPDPITNWSTTLNFQYDDYTAVQGEQYLYYVKAARNTYGLRESDFGEDMGFADECMNLIDDPAFRNVYLHGSTLDITQKITNEGPYDLLSQGQIAFALENTPPFVLPDYIIGYVDIPPLAVGESFNVDISVNLETVTGGPVPQGTWYVSCYTSWDFADCDANWNDDYIVWEELPFTYTDAMYGTYTIGPAWGDYYSIDKALLALQEKGISDNVTFYLEPVVYIEQLNIPAIAGAGGQKSIIFRTDPAKNDTAEIIFTPTPSDNYTIRFNNCSNIIFRDLKISTMGFTNYQSTYGRVIEFAGYCSDIQLKNNHITGFTDESNYSEDNAVIYCDNSNSNNIKIEGNEILFGTFGIFMEGANLNVSPLSGIEIIKNQIKDFVQFGISIRYIDFPVITGNWISSLPSSISWSVGVNIEYTRNGFDISENQVYMEPSGFTMYGMSISDLNLEISNVGTVMNNFISIHSNQTNNYGMSFFKMNKARIYNNTVHIYGTPGGFSTSAMINGDDSPVWGYDNEFKCNILSNQSDGYCLAFGEEAYNHQLIYSSDYNDFFTSGADLFFFKNSYGIQTLNQWYSETGFDQHSLLYDPVFLSDTDLHSNSEQLDNMGYPLTAVTSDIDGDPRDPVHPDIGADEYSYASLFFNLNVQVYLEGPFHGTGMNIDLSSGGLLPLSQPYNISPWYYYGSESVTSIPSNIVDWILIEVRDAPTAAQATPGTRIARQAAFLKKDGSIVGTDGTSILQFSNSITHQLFVVIWHRNHIEIMSAVPLLKVGDIYSYDFRTDVTQAYGNGIGYKDWGAGVAVMVAADGNADGNINNFDKIGQWNPNAGKKGYLSADFNMDSQINNTDKNSYWIPNLDEGFTSQVPE